MAGLYRRLITEGKKEVPEAGGARFQASVWQEQRAGRMTGVRKVLFSWLHVKHVERNQVEL